MQFATIIVAFFQNYQKNKVDTLDLTSDENHDRLVVFRISSLIKKSQYKKYFKNLKIVPLPAPGPPKTKIIFGILARLRVTVYRIMFAASLVIFSQTNKAKTTKGKSDFPFRVRL